MSGTFLSMSDEDFLKEEAPLVDPNEPKPVVPEEVPAEDPVPVEEQETETLPEQKTEEEQAPVPAAPGSSGSENEAPTPEATPEQKADEAKPGEQKEGAEETKGEAPDFKVLYERIMAPFKANGRMVELKSSEEAVQLMQMGANYTRKMQELAPHRKVLMMLEQNQLLDEGKLSFLIDIEKKNPEAIKKLVKDAGIDPMDMDMSTEPAYREGNHRVTDERVAFAAALEEMKSTEAGTKTIQAIHADWDDASKDEIYRLPAILGTIHQHREAGVYDRISAEVNRRRTLGAIPNHVPFIHAYKAVGDEMVTAGAFADLAPKPTAPTPPKPVAPVVPPAVVATRVEKPKNQVANGDKASAASPTRSAAPKQQAPQNPLAMSDEDFEKAFQLSGRL